MLACCPDDIHQVLEQLVADDHGGKLLALGNGAPAETYEGAWSDGTNVARLGVSDLPSPSSYNPGPYLVQWSDAANPRGNFPLVSGPPGISRINIASGQVSLTATNLLIGHSYVEQTTVDLLSGNWSNALTFVPAQIAQSFTNSINASSRFWRIFAP